MSTTTTSSDPDEPTPRRSPIHRALRREDGSRRRLFAAFGRRTRPGERRMPLVLSDRAQRRLVTRARKQGARDGSGTALDVVVLSSGILPPYAAGLAARRDLVRELVEEEAADWETRASREDANARNGIVREEAGVALAQTRLVEAEHDVRRAREQLDLLAHRSMRWQRLRDAVRERFERTGPGGGTPSDSTAGTAHGAGTGPPPRPGGFDEDDEYQTLNPVVADPHLTAIPTPAQGAVAASVEGWEGLRARAAMPEKLVLFLLVLVFAVEVPIYWVAFEPFHGVGTSSAGVLNATLAISVGVLMLAVPHLVGRAMRERGATGASRPAGPAALLFLGFWAACTVTLGILRARTVLAEEPVEEVTGPATGFSDAAADPVPSLVDRLELQPQTVYWMFIALLLLSGGIGFLAGLLREHPYVDSFRSALERREERARELAAAHTRLAAARAWVDSAGERAEQRRRGVDARLRAADELYEAAAEAHRHGLTSKAADPAITEAAQKRTESGAPLLPPSTTRRPPASRR
ncbi:hypothetical protein [Streptomyces xinghaiensis]|uniref:hypothetical protein n=1 Tax=Streptomyces xinghaiensis TaxID=1038928 RepID=UPI000584F29D|nr:hypothetical protein [Streptomyces xinghaiensis]MZE77275.1 hypothetical protein [Streptomyces sp. SID5475]